MALAYWKSTTGQTENLRHPYYAGFGPAGGVEVRRVGPQTLRFG
jgi:hypothetical protein